MQLDSKTAPAASYLCIRNMEDDSCNPTNRQKLTNSLRKPHKPLKAPQISPPKTCNLTQKSHQKTLSSHDSPQSNTPVRIIPTRSRHRAGDVPHRAGDVPRRTEDVPHHAGDA